MTKDVLVTISGNQFATDEGAVEVVTTGTYYMKNGKHYVLYEVQSEANGPVTKNRVKFHDGHFEMTKKGEHNGFLSFDRDQKTTNIYQSPAGPLHVDVATSELDFTEADTEISVKIKYALEINYQFISECEVDFKIRARAAE